MKRIPKLAGPPPSCAVPLLEAAVPKGATFTLQTIAPPKDYPDNRMSVKPPIPACNQASAIPPRH
jgi:hypothetical protein